MNKINSLKVLAAGAVLAGGLLFAAIQGFAVAAEDHGGGGAAGGALQVMPVQAMVVSESAAQIWSEYSGKLDAVEYALLRPQVSGQVVQIKFEDGQAVKKGDVLYVIDPEPFQAAVNVAAADLETAKSRNVLAQKELARARDLMKTDAVAGTVVDTRESEAGVAKSSMEAAAARLKQAKIDLGYAYVKAPISGRVGRAEITKGNIVQAGPNAPVLTSVVANEQIYADFDVDEQTYLSHVRGAAQGLDAEREVPVKMTVRGDTAKVYEGTIHSFDNRINPDTGTIRARALFKNDDSALLPGMFVTVKMGRSGVASNIMVPERAIGTDQDRKFVYVVDGAGKVIYREVKLGEAVNGSRVILSGLKAGETVIIEGTIRIRPDMVVAPQIKK